MEEQPNERHEARAAGRDAYSTYSRLLLDALTTAEALEASWSPRHGRDLASERNALFCALRLDAECQLALWNEQALPPESVATAATRYDVYAAIATVHQVLPFSQSERATLRSRESMQNVGFADESLITAPHLVDRWHEWLWPAGVSSLPHRAQPRGQGALLNEGCRRLGVELPEVMQALRTV